MADNKISVSDFVSKVLSLETLESREAYVNTVIKTKYLDFQEKSYWAKQIVDMSSYKRGEDGKLTNKIEIDSNVRYFSYVITVITAYTNIEFSRDASLDEFDLLEKNELNKLIFKCIGKEEMQRFYGMVENALDDLKTNHLEASSYIDATMNQLGEIGDGVMAALKDLFKGFKLEDLQTIVNLLGIGQSPDSK